MLRAAENVELGKPHARHMCHIDPFVTELYASIDCTLTQGFVREQDEDGNWVYKRDSEGNKVPKPTGVIHLGGEPDDPVHPDPIMRVKVGLKGSLLHHLCGELCVRVHLECIGKGPEEDYSTDTQRIDCDDCCGPDSVDADGWCYYEFEVTIPKKVFEKYGDDCGEVCCFAVTATSIDRCGNPGHIACWCNGPCVMIHTAPED